MINLRFKLEGWSNTHEKKKKKKKNNRCVIRKTSSLCPEYNLYTSEMTNLLFSHQCVQPLDECDNCRLIIHVFFVFPYPIKPPATGPCFQSVSFFKHLRWPLRVPPTSAIVLMLWFIHGPDSVSCLYVGNEHCTRIQRPFLRATLYAI